ncbi:AAA family ATPase [Agreia sp. COWG]|uniref:AAA family ATPase n=1 Tax=Agreia sp. COWG TaxID=2773266 RepID=UPI001928B54B|nr:AAA family ATPase [Agreia sp. COWG]CAD6010271.1 putative Chromosome segregation protein [Agreia sp. COWG]
MTAAGRLRSITISDFRSIRGQVTVPLDAPIILLHGLNGAGKTSVLSALELALSGSIDSMRRADDGYLQHLVHLGAQRATVAVEASRSDGSLGSWQMSSDEEGWAIECFLDKSDADFYRERSYLAQATLGRLLEIYGSSEKSQASALTRFVNDVLGLDSLESLITGLSGSKDLRNTKRLVPEIIDLEHEIKTLQAESKVNDDQLLELSRADKRYSDGIQDVLQFLADQLAGNGVPQVDLMSEESTHLDESALISIVGLRRDLESLRKRLQAAEQTQTGSDLLILEQQASRLAQSVAQWHTKAGVKIDMILEDMRQVLPELRSVDEVGPLNAWTAALDIASSEFDRASTSLEIDNGLLSRIEQLNASIEASAARLALINEQIAVEVVGAEDMARILGELIPHLHGEECIVCGRDFSEVSQEPLRINVARRAAEMSARARRISELNEARSGEMAESTQALGELASTSSQLLDPSNRAEMISQQARMRGWIDALRALTMEAEDGDQLVRESGDARRKLATMREDARTWGDLQHALEELLRGLGLDGPNSVEPLQDALARAIQDVEIRNEALEVRMSCRRRIAELERSNSAAYESHELLKVTRDELAERTASANVRSAALDRERNRAKDLLRISRDIQGSIVRKVFNESLNSIWRDLFVRLAPNERFVPAFHVAHDARDTNPQLVTKDRYGGSAGAPGSMLSSGNLNTAALTLFLALHLSSGDRLPLLVLDDPVQSMDDVHISQFAALLRTLARQHGRQILIAVHERSLYEYLTLELSPAFEGDSLVTVELKSHANGSTVAEPTYYQWREDPVRAAG